MPRREPGGLTHWRRGAEENPLLAAEQAAGVFGECGHVVVGHAGFDLGGNLGEYCVLHLRAFSDQPEFLSALDRLAPVDEVGGVNKSGAAEPVLEARDEGMRHAAG